MALPTGLPSFDSQVLEGSGRQHGSVCCEKNLRKRVTNFHWLQVQTQRRSLSLVGINYSPTMLQTMLVQAFVRPHAIEPSEQLLKRLPYRVETLNRKHSDEFLPAAAPKVFNASPAALTSTPESCKTGVSCLWPCCESSCEFSRFACCFNHTSTQGRLTLFSPSIVDARINISRMSRQGVHNSKCQTTRLSTSSDLPIGSRLENQVAVDLGQRRCMAR